MSLWVLGEKTNQKKAADAPKEKAIICKPLLVFPGDGHPHMEGLSGNWSDWKMVSISWRRIAVRR